MHPLRIFRWEDIVLDVGESEVARNIYFKRIGLRIGCGNGAMKSAAKSML